MSSYSSLLYQVYRCRNLSIYEGAHSSQPISLHAHKLNKLETRNQLKGLPQQHITAASSAAELDHGKRRVFKSPLFACRFAVESSIGSKSNCPTLTWWQQKLSRNTTPTAAALMQRLSTLCHFPLPTLPSPS